MAASKTMLDDFVESCDVTMEEICQYDKRIGEVMENVDKRKLVNRMIYKSYLNLDDDAQAKKDVVNFTKVDTDTFMQYYWKRVTSFNHLAFCAV